MKGAVAFLTGVLIAGCGGVTAKSSVDPNATLYPPNNGDICLLAGLPPSDVKYEILGRVVATKRSYGSSDELFLPMALEARKLGADALINLQAEQRFKGPLPWRVTSPTGDGQAIKVAPESPKIECLLAGGKLLGLNGLVTTIPPTQDVPEKAIQSNESINAESTAKNDIGSKPDLYTELIKLDDLRNKGILTDAEFATEKKELLGRN